MIHARLKANWHELNRTGQASPAAQRRLHQLAPPQQVPQIKLPGATQGSKGMLHIDAVVQGSHESPHALQAGHWEGRVESTWRQSVRAQSDFKAKCLLTRQPQDNILQAGCRAGCGDLQIGCGDAVRDGCMCTHMDTMWSSVTAASCQA